MENRVTIGGSTLAQKQKLELTWIGKDEQPKLEPRILLEDLELSYHAKERVTENDIFDNRLIFGDNLLALKALEQEFAGRIKCIFIDPPYNTGNAFEHYDDGLEHSIWLNMMFARLKILHKLLREDGFIFVQIDNNEQAYLKVIMDEIFGRNNFLNMIAYERSGSAGIGQGATFLLNNTEYILVYAKDKKQIEKIEAKSYKPLDKEIMKRYNKILIDQGSKELIKEFNSKSNGQPVKIYRHRNYKIETISLANFNNRKDEIEKLYFKYFDSIFRTTNPQAENSFQNELISYMDKDCLYSVEYIPSRGKEKGILTNKYYLNKEIFAWLKDSAEIKDNQVVKTNKMGDFWRNEDIPKANLANEGGVNFKRGKKPEALIKTILDMVTEEGDWVLDSFAGSGTTGAVAHKMRRRWIMIELGEHCHTHIIPRMKKVIDGTDQGGISKAVNWQGGGGFRYYKLAPSLLKKDKFGNWIINPEYNAEMLAEAMCKHEGFTYNPDPEVFWKQGQSTENDFIYTTTQLVTQQMVEGIVEQMKENETLLICCKAFNVNIDDFPQVTIKKIPQAILNKCEFGRDDYSLKINELPMKEKEPEQLELF
ncbi:site-specific DNA-methyltransferase [Aeribacillus sp. FSL K6-1305]|jgi:adenine-specific DNA-methyltransferase|uniref:site-specific DNA-methyltransferase n=1 Tax=Aeribacillus sp. FSL K6-1305 TaxID=2954569 RepID=UPI004047E258